MTWTQLRHRPMAPSIHGTSAQQKPWAWRSNAKNDSDLRSEASQASASRWGSSLVLLKERGAQDLRGMGYTPSAQQVHAEHGQLLGVIIFWAMVDQRSSRSRGRKADGHHRFIDVHKSQHTVRCGRLDQPLEISILRAEGAAFYPL